MALDLSNSSNLEQLALNGSYFFYLLILKPGVHVHYNHECLLDVAVKMNIFGCCSYFCCSTVAMLNRSSTQRPAGRPFSSAARDPDVKSPTLTDWNRESA